MSDLHIRIDGAAGRITLTRPKALNALTYDMCLAIEAALDRWRAMDSVELIVIDADGDKAFCAGGDIHQLYARGIKGDYEYGRQFWRDEYRMNLKLATFPKPVVSLLQGYTMGGGVGVGCHGSHRIVCESSRISMPEVGIGLVPDVGGSWILARAPGAIGEFLGVTAERLGPGDALIAGFADYFVPQDRWAALTAKLLEGQISAVAEMSVTAPVASLLADRRWIDQAFQAPDIQGIMDALEPMQIDAAERALVAIRRNSPLAMACAVAMIRSLRSGGGMALALAQEFRFSYRAMMLGDFLEGIRAAIIDRDHSPSWRHNDPASVTSAEVADMLAPLGDNELRIGEEHP